MTQNPQAEVSPTPLPQRGDTFDQWLKAQRDRWGRNSERWFAVDDVLDLYRLHADTGTPLTEHVCEGRMVGDCECFEMPAKSPQDWE